MLARLIRRARRGRPTRGQALVEFALVVPFFALLLFGIIDMARFVYSNNAVNEAAREAARQGTIVYRPAICNGLARDICVKTIAKAKLTAVPITLADVQVVCTHINAQNVQVPCGATWVANDFIEVTITKNFTLVTPMINQFLGPTIEGKAKVTANG